MTKEKFIEFVQHLLSGGQVVDDTEKKFPYQVVSMAVSMVVQDISQMDSRRGTSNIRNYLVTKHKHDVEIQVDGSRQFFELPYSPLSGSDSVIKVSTGQGDPAFSFHPNEPMMGMMSELKGTANMRTGFYPLGDRYYLTKNLFGNQLYIAMIPDVDDYDDDEEFVFQDKHLFVAEKVLELFRTSYASIMDQYNNQAIDNEQQGRI